MELMGGGKFSRCFVVVVVGVLFLVGSVSGIGVNWGTQSTHPLSPSKVVKMLKDNGIQKVKLFDADAGILDALKKSGIQVMVGIPNDMLYTLANSVEAAEKWVSKNISKHVSSGGVDIRYTLHTHTHTHPFLCVGRFCYQPLAELKLCLYLFVTVYIALLGCLLMKWICIKRVFFFFIYKKCEWKMSV